jgi:hypothetical protein
MVEIASVVFGGFLILGGTLTAINHPIIDGINRWLKALGTTQRPSDFEMSKTSVMTGRILGITVAVIGMVIAISGIV